MTTSLAVNLSLFSHCAQGSDPETGMLMKEEQTRCRSLTIAV